MERIPHGKIADMHLAHGAANGISREAVGIYRERFPNRHQTFAAIHRRLCETGHFSCHEAKRIRRVRDPEIEEQVLQHFQNNETTSIYFAANVLLPSQSTVWSVLHENDIHPFQIHRVQAINAEDYPSRVKFDRCFLHKEVETPSFPSSVFFS